MNSPLAEEDPAIDIDERAVYEGCLFRSQIDDEIGRPDSDIR